MGECTGRRLSPTYDEMAQLAFSLYETSGRQNGHYIEDRLCADHELVHYA
jgi:hypothetical protein